MMGSQHSTPQILSLQTQLREAAVAYYETGSPLMTDDAYDALVDQLKVLDPTNAFFQQVGANPSANVVKLPVPMASLDKQKPDTLKPGSLEHGPYVLMDKLDGISALWCADYANKPSLYLRGNGTDGQDVSHCIGGIQGLRSCNGMVRGELIVPKGVIQGTLARNWVNGQLHQGTPSKEELSKIRFVAYQVCKPASLTRSQQITWLQNNGFELAWFRLEAKPTVDGLSALFKERRSESPYECDGIVVCQDVVPVLSKSNPKDAFAFKMPLDDQRAQTIVKAVLWASSKTGHWIPRIQFEPVQIGTATIEFCSGFHANNIFQQGIGPGARILIRRSGDVIPFLEQVMTPSATGWQAPPEGYWSWDANHIHALDTSTEASPEKLALELTHGLVTFGIEGISKITAKKLVDGNVKTLQDVLKATKLTLQTLIGPTNGSKLADALPVALAKATQHQWIKAYLGWPKAFGSTRISAMLELEPLPAKWNTIGLPPKGISADSFAEIVKAVPAYLTWRDTFSIQTNMELVTPKPATSIAAVATQTKGHYVITGFRDSDLQNRLEAIGWIQQDRITKTTTLLLVSDTEKESTKTKAARGAGIRILPRNQVSTLF